MSDTTALNPQPIRIEAIQVAVVGIVSVLRFTQSYSIPGIRGIRPIFHHPRSAGQPCPRRLYFQEDLLTPQEPHEDPANQDRTERIE
jgi:hypothetical protein